MIKLIKYFYLFIIFFASILVLNMISLEAHNKNNRECNNHCEKNTDMKIINNKDTINKKIDIKQFSNSCLNNSLCKG